MIETGMYLYPWDIGDSLDAFTAGYARTGCNAVAAAVSYHHGNVLSARSGRTYRIPEAAIGFAPRLELYGRLKPYVRRELADAGTIRAIRDWCRETGRHFSAWTVVLHNSTLGRANPDVCCQNVFGDRYTHALCPSYPDVRKYVQALVHDVCGRLEPDSVMLESITVPTPFHGEHHEIANVKPGPAAQWLLSLCFCDHCMDAADTALAQTARKTCAAILKKLLNRETAIPGHEAEQLPALMLNYPELYKYQRTRGFAINALIDELAALTNAHGAACRVIPSAIPHPINSAFLEGMSYRFEGRKADMYLPLVYGAGETYANVKENIRLFDETTPVGMAMTLHPNRYPTRGDFLGAVADAARHDPACAYFYNYSLASEERLGWLRDAAAILGAPS